VGVETARVANRARSQSAVSAATDRSASASFPQFRALPNPSQRSSVHTVWIAHRRTKQ
jgi:hypothetical protein